MAANVLKRTSLKLGMIPADGIGKEVLPVRFRRSVIALRTVRIDRT